MRHTAQREPRRTDTRAIACDRGRRGDERELIRLAVAALQVVRGPTFRAGGHVDRDDKIASTEHVVTFRCVAWQAMEIGERDRSFARGPAHDDRRVQGGKRHRDVGRVRGDAGIRPAEDRVVAIEPVKGRAAGARPPLVAG